MQVKFARQIEQFLLQLEHILIFNEVIGVVSIGQFK
jgi:hypothetical protein